MDPRPLARKAICKGHDLRDGPARGVIQRDRHADPQVSSPLIVVYPPVPPYPVFAVTRCVERRVEAVVYVCVLYRDTSVSRYVGPHRIIGIIEPAYADYSMRAHIAGWQ